MQILMLILSLIYNLQIKLWPHVLRIAYILYYTEDYEIYTLTSFLMVVMLKRERWCAPSPSISCNCTRPLTEGNIFFTWLLTAVRWLWQRPSPSGSFGSGRPISSSTAQPRTSSPVNLPWNPVRRSHLPRPAEGDKTTLPAHQDIICLFNIRQPVEAWER